MANFIVHYGLHLFLPLLVAYIFFNPAWKKAWAVMLLGMMIDIDHLWATPIFDPNRCSVGFHIFHTWPFFIFYFIMILPNKTRWLGIGLVLHIITDIVDCLQRGHFNIF